VKFLSVIRQRKVAITGQVTVTKTLSSVLYNSRQSLPFCRVLAGVALANGSTRGPFDSFFAQCIRRHSVNVASLPSASSTSSREREHLWVPLTVSLPSTSDIAPDKEALPVTRCVFFTKCYGYGTRQITSLLSVTLGKVTRIPLFYLFLLFHPNNRKIYHKIITYIIESSHTSYTPRILQRP
jgi:hypothetical protein